jgi:hypothetical protein
MNQTQAEKQSVLEILQNLNSLDGLKKLCWEELNYTRENKLLGLDSLNKDLADNLQAKPILFASAGENNEFHVIYTQFKSKKLKLTEERAIINKLTRNHAFCLYVFSDLEQKLWHFVNVRLPEKDKDPNDPNKRKLIRRIVIAQDENLRTACERISLLKIDSDKDDLFNKQSALAIQKQHDDAFDVEKITEEFYNEYKKVFKILRDDLFCQTNDDKWAHDYALQFLNRLMFLYFVQRKGWMRGDKEFLNTFWQAYLKSGQVINTFVSGWLSDLFFFAFNNQKNFNGNNKYSKDIQTALQLAPYLNGGLFDENKLDTDYKTKFTISDTRFEQIIKFLNYYNFTIREDSPLDQEVAVDAEMLGKVYESLVNVSEEIDERGDAGIFYTQRIEIDLMCRLSLVDNLTNNIGDKYKNTFYEFVFALDDEEKIAADKQIADCNLWNNIYEHLNKITIVDPACGSGSFLVGSLLIVDDLILRTEQNLKITRNSYDRRKQIICNSLYGVDVMQWAVEVAELRLWLQLVIETDLDLGQRNNEPLLPKLSFKIRHGDSLVQPIPSIKSMFENSFIRFPQSFSDRHRGIEKDKKRYFNNEFRDSVDAYQKIEDNEYNLYESMISYAIEQYQSRIDGNRDKLEGVSDALGMTSSEMDENKTKKLRKDTDTLISEHSKIVKYMKIITDKTSLPFIWDKDFNEIFVDDKGGFDIVIGNPPYVRQEKISDPMDQAKTHSIDSKKNYKTLLANEVYSRFPSYFKDKKISAKSDLYVYFYYIGMSLLNSKGSFCFITSNSWLDVGYGAGLQEFLLKCNRIEFIIDNEVKRSFSASVNTIIALLSVPDTKVEDKIWSNREAKFVNFVLPYEEILSAVIFTELEESINRKTTSEYKTVTMKHAGLMEAGIGNNDTDDDDSDNEPETDFGNLKYTGDVWGGKYLRAPDIYWKMIELGGDKLEYIYKVADVRFGIKTGVDDYFFLSSDDVIKWNIEPEYLIPILKTAKDSKTISVSIHDLKTSLFYCSKNKAELKGTNALKYIDWGESNNYHKIQSVKGRKLWYNVGQKQPADGILLRRIGERYVVFEGNGVLENCVLFGITRKTEVIDKDVFLAILNSTITRLIIETLSSQLTGAQTVSDTNVYIIKKIPIVNPLLLNENQKSQIKQLYNQMKLRPILPFREEVNMPDRIESDKILMEAIGLSGKDDLEELYNSMAKIINKRMTKSDSMKNKS